MRRLSNLRIRFTLLYGSALIATVLIFSIGIYVFVERMLISQINNHLHKDMTTVSGYLLHDQAGLLKLASMGPVHLFRVRDGNRDLIASDEWKNSELTGLLDGGDFAAHPKSITTPSKRQYRIQSQLFPLGDTLYQVVVAHEESNYQRTLNTLALIILLAFPVSIAISLVVGYLIAGRVLAPITTITSKASEIGAENLSARLPVNNEVNEFTTLATVFNQTFSRLEESFERLRCFTADASHELRTPLTAIRSIGETALQQQSVSPACRETIGSMLEETDRLVQTVESLLLLSRTDGSTLQKEPAELGNLLTDVIEFLSVLAEEKQQQILYDRRTSLTILADHCMLRRAFLNLVDNAIKYSPEQTTIKVIIYRDSDENTVVEVSDNGPGIPDTDKERVFDRFYRLDTGRTREKGGTGLGLSITKAAIEAHGGTIAIFDNPDGGTLFKAVFPLAKQDR
ncbi:MAG: ATP-binding protein [Geobacter sp.]|nr:ATP-binding protein [Geobacter sp.]